MKKQTLISILFLLLFFTFGLNKAKAHPGDSCASAISLTVGTLADYSFNSPDTVEWFSFIADSTNMSVSLSTPILPADTPTAAVRTLKVYSGSCSGLTLLGSMTVRLGSDSLPVFYKTGMTMGTKYYVSVSKYNNAGCRICNTYPSYFSIIAQGEFSTPPPAVICMPVCSQLVCNGDFTYPPVGSPTCYKMPDATPPSPCTSGSAFTGMPYSTSACGWTLYQDPSYMVGYHPGPSNWGVIYKPTDGRGGTYSFLGNSPSGSNPPVVAWQQNVAVTASVNYQFTMWYMELDDIGIFPWPPATLTINLGAAPPVSVVAGGNTWQEICINYTAPITAVIAVQIMDGSYVSGNGRDFQIQGISFGPIVVNANIASHTNPTCNGGTGTASVTASNGSSPYTYSWSPSGGTNATATGLTAGSYTVTVTDLGGCTATVSVTLTQPTAITASIAPTYPPCNGGTGSATVTAGGGISPYIYLWTPTGQTNATATGLIAGSYTVKVTDHNGCTNTTSITITQPAALNVTFNPTSPEICSYSGSTATTSVTAVPTGGTPAYTYLWNNGQTNATATGLILGSYTVTVTDSHGCSTTASVSVTTDHLAVSVANAVICGSGTTSLTAIVTPGVGPYAYLWTPTSQTTAIATGLTAGTYSVTVTDAIGCTASASAVVSVDHLAVSISEGSSTPPNPCVGSSVSLTANVTPGVPTYAYLWSNGATTSTTNINPVLAGSHNYTVTVTDANGCTASSSINITADNLSTSASVTSNVSCHGGSNGSASASPSGGITPYTYLWLPGSQTTASATGLAAGVYTVTVTDHNGCTATASVTITQPTAITITFNPTNPQVCTTVGTTTVTANPSGGTPGYAYSWNNGQTNATATGLAIGNYIVTVTDAHGCTSSASVSVTLDNISASITAVGTSNLSCCTTPEFCPNVSGGSAPYVYTWSITGGSTTAGPPPCIYVSWSNIYAANTLTLTVVDNNGCTASATYTTTACCGPPNAVAYMINNLTLYSYPTSNITLVGSPSITWVSSQWQFDNFDPGTSSLAIYGTFDINANVLINCSDVLMGTGSQIIVEPGYTLDIEISHLHACDNMWDNIDVKPGATLIINNSLVENAQQAVYAENGPTVADKSSFTLTQTIFNINNIGVEVMPYPYPHNGYIAQCTFSSDQASGFPCITGVPFMVNTTPNAQFPPNNPNRGAFGVVVHGVNSLTIGDPSYSYFDNTFIDIDCGVYTESSSTTVVNSNFTHMTPVTGSITNNTNVQLAGVYAKGGTTAPPYELVVGGPASGTYNQCYFTECQYGIWARDTIFALIEDNYVEGYPPSYSFGPIPNPQYGIYLEDNYATELHVIENNTINDCKYGVGAYNNSASYVMIDTNYSFTSGSWWSNCNGVDIYEVTSSPTYWVIDNTMGSVDNGVVGTNLNGAKIVLNDITLNGAGSMDGIEVDNGTASFIKRNYINGGTYTGSTGIFINMGSSPSQVKCNTLYYPYTGLSINNTQYPITIEQNEFDMPLTCTPVGTGLQLNSGGYIGVNSSPASEINTWNISPCTSLVCTGSPAATNSNVPGNGFVIPSTASCVNDPPVSPQYNDGGINQVVFYATGPADSYNCLSSPFFAIAPPPSPHNALVLMNDSIHFTQFPQTSKWEAKYGLYNYLYTVDSSLVDSNRSIKHFYDSATNANMGKIVRINQLFSDIHGVSANDLATAQSLNNAIVNPDTAESIYQNVYAIILAMNNAGGQYIPQVPAQIATLKSIAPLCPQQYGYGVFLARALLSQIDTTRWPNTCTQNGEGGGGEGNGDHKAQKRTAQIPDTLNNIMAKVYPNPANTMLDVEVNMQNGQTVYFVMYNAIGEKIESMPLTNEMTSLSINNFPSGMYYYRITDKNGNVIKADKQMILH